MTFTHASQCRLPQKSAIKFKKESLLVNNDSKRECVKILLMLHCRSHYTLSPLHFLSIVDFISHLNDETMMLFGR